MNNKLFSIYSKQIIIHTDGDICSSSRSILQSSLFSEVITRFVENLVQHKAPMVSKIFPNGQGEKEIMELINLLKSLCVHPLDQVATFLPIASYFLSGDNRKALFNFVEKLYDFWRSFDRFMVLHSEPFTTNFEQRPYRSFNDTSESLAHLVRSTYRDICENITGDHPRVYRQVAAGCNVGLIAVPKQPELPEAYKNLVQGIPCIRQVWIAPPMIIDPPMNKRTGEFSKVNKNPVLNLTFNKKEWLCYPAQVGPLVIFIYFHQRFIGLASSLANLFDLATDSQMEKKPDAIYFYGVAPEDMAEYGPLPTIFYDDEIHDLLVAAVPREDKYGYFGYLKKMVLTLHNIAMMKKGRLPFHGAMVSIGLKSGRTSNILLIGDTATGKSESLEALRFIGEPYLSEMVIVADDMGSLEAPPGGKIRAYGTEIGAFVRLDDLQLGYAFGQLDRAVIMSPQKINARLVMPITTMEDILKGYEPDYVFYANNYEPVDEEHPVIEMFENPGEAMDVFRKGTAMSKGTTTSSGLNHTYFANVFGPVQFKELHDPLANQYFERMFQTGIRVGQLRTQLAVAGFESKGPEAAAKTLLEILCREEKPHVRM